MRRLAFFPLADDPLRVKLILAIMGMFVLSALVNSATAQDQPDHAELRKRFEMADFRKQRELAGELVKAGPESAEFALMTLWRTVKGFRAPESYLDQAVRHAPKHAIPTLMKAILEDTKMQTVAISLLGRHYDVARMEIEKALRHPDERVRMAAMRAVQRAGAKAGQSADVIAELLNDPNVNIRHKAAHTTVIFKPNLTPRCSKILTSVFDAQDVAGKLSIIRLYSRASVRFEHALPMFELAMKDTDPLVRLWAARAHFRDVKNPADESIVVPFDKAQVVRIIVDVLNDKDPVVRYKAANELMGRGIIDDKTLATVYRDVLQVLDPKLYYRKTVIRQLGKLGAAAAIALPELRKVVDDDVPAMRIVAATSIAHIDPKATNEVMPILIDALTRNIKGVRKRLVWLELAKLGPRAASTVPALRLLLRQKKSRYKVSIAMTLVQIEGGKTKSDYEIIRRYLTLKEGSLVSTSEFRGLGEHGKPLLDDAIAILHVPNHSRLSAVLELVKGMGADAKKAMPVLTSQLQREQVDWRRRRLAATIKAIQGGPSESDSDEGANKK